MHPAVESACRNIWEPGATPSCVARRTASWTYSGCMVMSRGAATSSLAMSPALSPHCLRNATLGSTTFSRSEERSQ
uniref:Uncharacterized protein n=1 Tax=Arundo donax TaxID=35708 RepID=A0A0A9GT26_ARUDO